MLLPTLFAVLSQAGPQVNGSSLDHWRSLIVPAPAECQFQQIGWKATMWSAVVEAQKQDRPILLWAMNGHPLACT